MLWIQIHWIWIRIQIQNCGPIPILGFFLSINIKIKNYFKEEHISLKTVLLKTIRNLAQFGSRNILSIKKKIIKNNFKAGHISVSWLSELWIYVLNPVFRIQLWIFRVPDPDPGKSSGSGSNLYLLSIFRNSKKTPLKFNQKEES